MSRTTDRNDYSREHTPVTRETGYRDDARKDPATLEREIDQTRAEMDRTLGALERKLSPGQLLDEGLKLVKEHGGDFFTNLGTSVKENPLPVILTGVGLGWIVMSNDRSRASGYRRYADRYDTSAQELGRSLSRTAEETTAQASERLKAGAQATRERLADSGNAVAEKFSRTTEATQKNVERMGEGLKQMFQEQPLILGALGIALGAAIGAALPRTEHENRMLGDARDRTFDNIKQRGAESYEHLKETANQAGEEVKQLIPRAPGEATRSDHAHTAPGPLPDAQSTPRKNPTDVER